MVTQVQLQQLIAKYQQAWDAAHPAAPLYIVGAAPGDIINLPGGVTFGAKGQQAAGMELPVAACHLIVLNKAMVPESMLSTFLHEYGHARYRVTHVGNFDGIDAEAAAIMHSLEALEAEGFPDVARREAKAVVDMAGAEPYASAVQRIKDDPIWKRYAPP